VVPKAIWLQIPIASSKEVRKFKYNLKSHNEKKCSWLQVAKQEEDGTKLPCRDADLLAVQSKQSFE
jgi:hypothetical protein